MILAGFDEAGYGPKLGPLTVGWSAFELEARGPDPSWDEVDLWDLLDPAVRRAGRGDKNKLWIADSKVIKPRKDGVKTLELGVLAFQGAAREKQAPVEAGGGHQPLPELLAWLGQPCQAYERIPWYQDLGAVCVPLHAWPGEVAARAERLREACRGAGLRCLGAGVRVLEAARYNQRIASTQNKGQVLGETVVELLRELRARKDGPMDVVCDKHGGRSTYLRLLGAAFPLCPLDVDKEGPEESVYRAKTPKGPVRVSFRQGAEDRSLPVALASMHCKYLREVFMDRLNAWFQERLPGLKKTAGYALDAKRFLGDVGAELPRLGVSHDILVRAR